LTTRPECGVRATGVSVCHTRDDLEADKEVVLAAVVRDGRALQYASADLMADKQVVLAAVRDEGGPREDERKVGDG